jgi:prepilin-type N-terminal cleavage/methylation domain-containing protein
VRRRGFTLVEVLVALAIMVVLFALLFAPMMAGLDWVSTGKANVNLQNAARFAMEQIRRELGEAAFVVPTTDIVLPTENVADTSQLTFCPPERDSLGRVLAPVHGRVDTVTSLLQVVRYHVHLLNINEAYSETNPFVLYRQQLLYDPSQADGRRVGLFNSSGNWCYSDTTLPGCPTFVENALTPSRGCTFVPTTTVCRTCGAKTAGYAAKCPVTGCGSTDVAYLYDNIQFVPHRVVGEELHTDNGITYQSKYGAWDGVDTTPAVLASTALTGNALTPHLSMFQWNPAASPAAYNLARSDMDSSNANTRSVLLNIDSERGRVEAGTQVTATVTLALDSNGWYSPPSASPLPAGIAAIWPAGTGGVPTTTPADAANAPIALRIDPTQGGTLNPCVIETGSIRARVIAVSSGVQRQIDLKPSPNFDQPGLKGDEFCPVIYRVWRDINGDGRQDATTEPVVGTGAEVRFSRYDPPRPSSTTLFTQALPTGSTFTIQISYYLRRNYVYDATSDASGGDPWRNDVIRVDYSTRSIQNVVLSPMGYTPLEADTTNPLIFRLPRSAAKQPNVVSLREQVFIRNMVR